MKKGILFIMLFWAVAICAQQTMQLSPIQGFEYQHMLVNPDNSMTITPNGDIHLVTFSQNGNGVMYHKFSNTGEHIASTIINDSESPYAQNSTQPVITSDAQGNVYVFYYNQQAEAIACAISRDNGLAFETQNYPNLDIKSMLNVVAGQDCAYIAGENLSQNLVSDSNYMIDHENIGPDVHRFWGPDVMLTQVHFNNDLFIRQLGGGNNNGWPTFYGKVTTSRRIRVFPSFALAIEAGAPMDDIFRGGYEENVPEQDLSGQAINYLQAYGERLFPSDVDIVAVRLYGNFYTSMYGYINEIADSNFVVYDIYPDATNAGNTAYWGGKPLKYVNTEGDTIVVTNQVTLKDTIWTSGASGLACGTPVFVESTLWIEGEVKGAQLWGAAGDVYITNDITYFNTPVGQAADGNTLDEGGQEVNLDNANNTDYFTLAAANDIVIKYKNVDPFDVSETPARVSPNCDDVNLYGTYISGNSFKIEYLRPHGSTPDFTASNPITGQQQSFTHVDLHKYVLDAANLPPQLMGFAFHSNSPVGTPNVCGAPYPGGEPSSKGGYYTDINYSNPVPGEVNSFYTKAPWGTDYPWYNPVWPEPKTDIVFLRGDLNVFGSISINSYTYWRVSGNDPAFHDNNMWNPDESLMGGTHPPTGYTRHFYPDSRPILNTFGQSWLNTATSQANVTVAKIMASNTGQQLLTTQLPSNSHSWSFSGDDSALSLYTTDINAQTESIVKHVTTDNGLNWATTVQNSSLPLAKTGKVNQNIAIGGFGVSKGAMVLNNNTWMPDSYSWAAQTFSSTIGDNAIAMVQQSYSDPIIVNWFGEDQESQILIDQQLVNAATKIYNNTLYLMGYNQNGQLCFGTYANPITAADDQNTTPAATKMVMTANPNPFNPLTQVHFNTVSAGKVTIEAYNLKGQRVETLLNKHMPAGQHQITWQANQPSGVYFLRLNCGGKQLTHKVTLLK